MSLYYHFTSGQRSRGWGEAAGGRAAEPPAHRHPVLHAQQHVRPDQREGAQLGPGDQRRRDRRVQQARGRAAYIRGQGQPPGERVRQVPQHRHRRRRGQCPTREVVCR